MKEVGQDERFKGGLIPQQSVTTDNQKVKTEAGGVLDERKDLQRS